MLRAICRDLTTLNLSVFEITMTNGAVSYLPKIFIALKQMCSAGRPGLRYVLGNRPGNIIFQNMLIRLYLAN